MPGTRKRQRMNSVFIRIGNELKIGTPGHIDKPFFLLGGIPAPMMILRGLNRNRFIQLDHRENQEIVIGLIGQFWKLNGNLRECVSAEPIRISPSYPNREEPCYRAGLAVSSFPQLRSLSGAPVLTEARSRPG